MASRHHQRPESSRKTMSTGGRAAPIHHRGLQHLVVAGTGVGLQDRGQGQLRGRHRWVASRTVLVGRGQLGLEGIIQQLVAVLAQPQTNSLAPGGRHTGGASAARLLRIRRIRQMRPAMRGTYQYPTGALDAVSPCPRCPTVHRCLRQRARKISFHRCEIQHFYPHSPLRCQEQGSLQASI
jgi:hypothetical protein